MRPAADTFRPSPEVAAARRTPGGAAGTGARSMERRSRPRANRRPGRQRPGTIVCICVYDMVSFIDIKDVLNNSIHSCYTCLYIKQTFGENDMSFVGRGSEIN